MINTELLAYFAGVCDSDGSLGLGKRTHKRSNGIEVNYYYPEIRIGLKSNVTIAHLHGIIKCGKVYKQKDGMTLLYIYGKSVKPVLELISRYMITKRPQADLLMDYLTDPKYPNDYYFERMKDLKKIAYAS